MIRSFIVAVLVAGVAFVGGCTQQRGADSRETGRVGLGIDSFLKNPPKVVRGKRIGLITNHTGVDSQGRSDIDTIREMDGVELVALFSPEHGLRGDDAPGAHVASGVDERSGLPVYSLYGPTAESRKPTPEMLKDVDVLVFDIQDVGARCYTYPYTMANCMKAAKENGKPFVVLDRPNPIGGEMIEGNILDERWSTFVGMYPIPMRHGMTVGELAKLFNERFGIGCELTVVRCAGLRRSMWWDDTGLTWVKPSPNLPRPEATIHYPGTVAFEGTNLSVGRGTDYPFEQVGAPWLDSAKVIDAMNAAGLSGVRFEVVTFTPTPMGDKKYDNQLCQGVRLVVLDRNVYEPVRTSAVLVDRIRAIHPDEFQFRKSHFDRLAGTDRLRISMEAGTLNGFLESWDRDEEAFREARRTFMMYKRR